MLSGDIFVNYELTALADLPAAFAAFYALERFGRTHTLAGAQVKCLCQSWCSVSNNQSLNVSTDDYLK